MPAMTMVLPKKAWVWFARTFGNNKKMAMEHAKIIYSHRIQGKKIMLKRRPGKKNKTTGFYEYDIYYEFPVHRGK